MVVLVNVKEAFQWEFVIEQLRWGREKEEIEKEIIAHEATLAYWREFEEEVKKEMALERKVGILKQRIEGFSFP